MKKIKFKRILLCALLGLAVSSYNTSNTAACNYGTTIVPVIDNTSNNENNENININNSKRDVLKNKLINEVNSYIKTKTSKFNPKLPEYLVNKCLEENVELCFVMAQTEIETCFGTAGIGREKSRHSLFGIYKTYRTYEDCINHYFEVLKKNYLTNGRTEHNLMKRYVTTKGSRYAGNPNYERELSGTYRKIKSNTSIYDLQSQYNNI